MKTETELNFDTHTVKLLGTIDDDLNAVRCLKSSVVNAMASVAYYMDERNNTDVLSIDVERLNEIYRYLDSIEYDILYKAGLLL